MIKTRKNIFLFFVAISFVSLFFVSVDITKAGDAEYASCLLGCSPTDTECTRACRALRGDGEGDCGAGFTPVGGVCFPDETGLPDSQDIPGILSSVLKWLLGIFSTIALISFVISGVLYITSSGDTDQIEKAKRNALYSILGVIVGLSGYIIIVAIQAALGGNSTF
ncbi:MAG TPA: pilin [Candidatus Moranbacteria bacterium]|nr:pilin [Candidatus Moranbacteria bacterium]HRZ33514.1 pilin [Candidatus Moranbacteria bacterium]